MEDPHARYEDGKHDQTKQNDHNEDPSVRVKKAAMECSLDPSAKHREKNDDDWHHREAAKPPSGVLAGTSFEPLSGGDSYDEVE